MFGACHCSCYGPINAGSVCANKTARHHCGFPFLPLQTQIAGAASGAVQTLAFKHSARNTLPKRKLEAAKQGCPSAVCARGTLCQQRPQSQG